MRAFIFPFVVALRAMLFSHSCTYMGRTWDTGTFSHFGLTCLFRMVMYDFLVECRGGMASAT
jgi:hypothetical protein